VRCSHANANADHRSSCIRATTCVVSYGWYSNANGRHAYRRPGAQPIAMHSAAASAIASCMLCGGSLARSPESCAKNAKNGILTPAWWNTPAEANSRSSHTAPCPCAGAALITIEHRDREQVADPDDRDRDDRQERQQADVEGERHASSPSRGGSARSAIGARGRHAASARRAPRWRARGTTSAR
jgi:hypothetical protein